MRNSEQETLGFATERSRAALKKEVVLQTGGNESPFGEAGRWWP